VYQPKGTSRGRRTRHLPTPTRLKENEIGDKKKRYQILMVIKEIFKYISKNSLNELNISL
jgi:hypothetical protein